jgi:hypothetical protein
MNAPMESHEPTAEFRAHLEWQIQTALRRESRLALPVSSSARRLSAALVVVAALATGGLAGIASGRVQDARQRDQLIETAHSQQKLLELRADLARAAYQDARRRFDVGTTDRETLLSAEREVHAMEAAIKRNHLDIEEIEMTSVAPRNDLDAPVVKQRDFVRERLALDVENARNALVAAEQNVAQARQRVDVGTAPRAVQLQAEAEVAQARAAMQLLQAKLDLRQRYLKGDITRESLAPSSRRAELTLQLEQSRREIELARARVEEIRRLVAVGQGTELDLKRSEVELLEREEEIKQVQRELQMLGTVKR